MRIVIAEDALVYRHLLESTLRKWGYDVVSASDGTQAWEILKAGDRPTLAVLDWMMPGLTGPELCRLIRKNQGDQYTYVLLLTSRGQKEDLIEGMDAGADDYLTKPFDHNELKVRVRAGQRIVQLHQDLIATREALRDQATRDALTHLWNRGSILATLQRELTRGAREDRPLGLVLMDLDRFKNVNDTWGHAAGDRVLVEASRRMQETIRTYDAVGRYGGEEFLILLPGCDEASTSDQAERMRCALASTPVTIGDISYTMTGSFGATSAIPASSTSVEQLIRRADDALYRAKNLGRNRVELAESRELREFVTSRAELHPA